LGAELVGSEERAAADGSVRRNVIFALTRPAK
jgi:hypothetical protein